MNYEYISPFKLDPERGASLLDRLRAIGHKHVDVMERGFKSTPNYNLDFAQQLVEKYEREAALLNGRQMWVTDDPHRRSDEGFMDAFARWANIHRNWPAVLFKPHEFVEWKRYYFHNIDLCNRNGLYLAEVLKWNYHMDLVPDWLREKINHQTLFDEVSVAMLIKYRWYRMTMSRHHKPDRLEQTENEFLTAIR